MPEQLPRQESSAPHTDEDPLISGTQTSRALSRLRQFFPGVRFWKRQESSLAASSDDHDEDLETGIVNAADFTPDTRQGDSNSDLTGRQTEGASSSRSQGGSQSGSRQGSPKGGVSPRSSEESQTAAGALLGAIHRLGNAALPRNPSLTPTCLICLEVLTPEEFESGEAIILDCECRGEMAMRHRACAEKWSQVKGNRTCDICKTMVKNLPEVPPQLPDSATTQNGFDENGEMLRNNALILSEQTPSGADVVFDCIRVTWVAMIVSILFFNMDIANALWTGVIFGLGYTIFVRAMYRHQLRQLMREQQQQTNSADSPSHDHAVHVV